MKPNVIKSFFLSHSLAPHLHDKAVKHCKFLASRYGFQVVELSSHGFKVALVTNIGQRFDLENEHLTFSLGQIADHPIHWDRYLKVSLSGNGIEIENDYAGSIPVFFSHRFGLTLSNIEPCVFLGSDSSVEDISYANLYGFLRYSHFIWDETAWSHIHQMEPDSNYLFPANNTCPRKKYLARAVASTSRTHLSDALIADEFFELNRTMVTRSLIDAEEIILPLSSGYDSRLIFAVLANSPELASKTRCFTYGPSGSLERESANRLARLKKMDWHGINLPCKYLDPPYLTQASNIFGASLHMHGMYQIEFHEQIRSSYPVSSGARLTSGFMTGVPAGQHNGLLNIKHLDSRLTSNMNRFSQSQRWTDDQLQELPIFRNKDYLDLAEERFRKAFDRLDGDLHHKAVMFDIWTRQRNFISYYPRIFEWLGSVSSPHMNTDYINFFMSLSRSHLHNRKAVELMLLKHYPDIARVASNSNGFKSLGNPVETSLLFLSRVSNLLGMPNPFPNSLRNTPIEFDMTAVNKCKENSFYPLFTERVGIIEFLREVGGSTLISKLYQEASAGDVLAYSRILPLQAVAMNLLLNEQH